jgi:hypothetical protein
MPRLETAGFFMRQPKRDIISAIAASAPVIVIAWLFLSFGWKRSLVAILGFAALLVLLMWLFPPAIDDEDQKSDSGLSNQDTTE